MSPSAGTVASLASSFFSWAPPPEQAAVGQLRGSVEAHEVLAGLQVCPWSPSCSVSSKISTVDLPSSPRRFSRELFRTNCSSPFLVLGSVMNEQYVRTSPS